jgi:hypothetical protein
MNTLTVTFGAGQPSGLCPPAVAVHNHTYVLGHTLAGEFGYSTFILPAFLLMDFRC